jgi:hypothetical protein
MKKDNVKEIPLDFITGKFNSVDLYIPEMEELGGVTNELNRVKKIVAEANNNAVKEKAEKELKKVKARWIALQVKINSAWYYTYVAPIEQQLGTKKFMELIQQHCSVYESSPNAPAPIYNKPYEEDPSQWERHPYFKKNESEISDKEFFKIIRGNPVFLGFPFAQQKIRRWRKEMRDKDKGRADNARDNLMDIGKSLAFKGWDKTRSYETVVTSRHFDTYNKLKTSGISKFRSEANKILKLKELFGAKIIDSINGDKALKPIDICTNRELADFITAKYFQLSPETVRTYLKRVTPITYGNGLQAFILKKPRK